MARTTALLAAVASAATLLFSTSAAATDEIQIVNELTGIPCPAVTNSGGTVSGGCVLHIVGTGQPMFWIDSIEANCDVEVRFRLNQYGQGYVTSFSPTPGDSNCATVAQPCGLPWPVTMEETAAGTATGTISNACYVMPEVQPWEECLGMTQQLTISDPMWEEYEASATGHGTLIDAADPEEDLGWCHYDWSGSVDSSAGGIQLHVNHL